MTWKIGMLLALIAWLIGLYALGYSNGADNVQKKWNIEKAKIQAVAEAEKARNLKTVAELNEQHKKEIEHAKSEAGRAAVNRWLRGHGLLPSGFPVRDADNSPEANSAEGANAPTCKCGTSGSLEEFAVGCGIDASTVILWQEWAVREALPVE